MDKEPLISIVIPVYNVSAYLKRCLDSVCTQLYENLEIILVDDGSTDNSGVICDEYAKLDNRILVIHKENGGLSDARNAGIAVSQGDYISFIDSDDFVGKLYIQRLVRLLLEFDADISIANQQNFSDYNKIKKKQRQSIKVFNGISAIEDMWYQRNIKTSAWGKLYKKELFQEIEYPKGKIYEDLGTTYKLFYLSEKIVYSSEVLYYYYQRNDSTMNKKFTLEKMDRIELSKELLEWAVNNCLQLKDAAIARFFISNMQVLQEIPNINVYHEQIQFIKRNIEKYRVQVIFNKNVKFVNRIIACCACFEINLLKKLGFFYKKIYK